MLALSPPSYRLRLQSIGLHINPDGDYQHTRRGLCRKFHAAFKENLPCDIFFSLRLIPFAKVFSNKGLELVRAGLRSKKSRNNLPLPGLPGCQERIQFIPSPPRNRIWIMRSPLSLPIHLDLFIFFNASMTMLANIQDLIVI